MRLVTSLIVSLSLYNLFSCYRARRDERNKGPFYSRVDSGQIVSIEEENELFASSGICQSENRSVLNTCENKTNSAVRKWQELQLASCFCDDFCHFYGDCCADLVGHFDYQGSALTCRKLRDPVSYFNPIYVYQECPEKWDDPLVADLCKMEAMERKSKNLYYDHRQDIPVYSKSSRIFYRNVYCAICNDDLNLEKWSTYLYCNGSPNAPDAGFEDSPDFSTAFYDPRTNSYRGVQIEGVSRNCFIVIKNFRLDRLLEEYGARLCKKVVGECPSNADSKTAKMCRQYSSYVYELNNIYAQRKVFKNFHCAMCHGTPAKDLSCVDPVSRGFSSPLPPSQRLSLSLLFDFNFGGDGGGGNTCELTKGQIWDPLFRQCQNVTCGALYKRNGNKCVPISPNKTDEDSVNNCLRKVLNKEMFTFLPDGRVYVNISGETFKSDEFEIITKENDDVIQIAVCWDVDTNLMPNFHIHYWLTVITLSISIVCLVLHLSVYGMFKTLRNCPGKILMCLSSSLLCGHFSLLLGSYFVQITWLCYANSLLMHFGYIGAFTWMSVMAFDICRTFSAIQSKSSNKDRTFIKYSIYAWCSAIFVVALSVIVDNLLASDNKFRPRYGNPICWFNHRYGLIVFFTVPVAVLLLANIILFGRTALSLREVSRQTKLVNNFSEKMRYFLYLKLAVVLGLTWILGFVAGAAGINALWYPFIILNGLQGALIFLSFTVKRNILNMLSIKFRLRSDKYTMSKRTGFKAAMYTSLTNLTSMSINLSSQMSTSSESKDMLKSVRKINPDAVLEKANSK
ncbi:uncharacterized protein [Parasteatoda tepidariorum]|uniref:uncharacterized protein n=1 Tax=Parasteatoda tepidariorum TaxID=114398 RepID=UPI001C7253BF|nr:uncharacterized protein LOC107436178 [Parasteatoda tepidariorum]